MTVKYIGDQLNHWGYDNPYLTLTNFDDETNRALHQFLSNHPEYMDGDLTIRVFDGSIGSNFLLFDNRSGLYIADLTDYENW